MSVLEQIPRHKYSALEQLIPSEFLAGPGIVYKCNPAFSTFHVHHVSYSPSRQYMLHSRESIRDLVEISKRCVQDLSQTFWWSCSRNVCCGCHETCHIRPRSIQSICLGNMDLTSIFAEFFIRSCNDPQANTLTHPPWCNLNG